MFHCCIPCFTIDYNQNPVRFLSSPQPLPTSSSTEQPQRLPRKKTGKKEKKEKKKKRKENLKERTGYAQIAIGSSLICLKPYIEQGILSNETPTLRVG